MTLLPLLISAQQDDVPGAGDVSLPTGDDCAYCGGALGLHAEGPSCVACTLVRRLDRPRIDEEACIVWLPEMTQAALVCLVREMHCQMRATGDGFDAQGAAVVLTPERRALYHARTALFESARLATEYVGTNRPSELAQLLTRISRTAYQHRQELLGGVRVVPCGRFFVGAADVYPDVVDSWRERTVSAANKGSQGSAA
jgi:intracellular multiplication protein IcmJ